MKNLVVLAPVLGAISRPATVRRICKQYRKFTGLFEGGRLGVFRLQQSLIPLQRASILLKMFSLRSVVCSLNWIISLIIIRKAARDLTENVYMKSNNQTDSSEETPDKNSLLFCLGKKLIIVKLY